MLNAIYDTLTYSHDSVRVWLTNLESHTTELLLALDYMGSGETANAMATLSGIPNKFDLTASQQTDLSYTQALFGILDGRDKYNLGTTERGMIAAIAATHGEFAPGIAKNILEYYGTHFPPENCELGALLLQQPNTGQQVAVPSEKPTLSVFPNPASNSVKFNVESNRLESASTLTVSDITGKTLWQTHMDIGTAEKVWDTSSIPKGVYFYKLKLSNGTEESGKIIIQK